MDCTSKPEFEADECERRQQLAMARRQRESERKVLLDKFVDTKMRADSLRSWLSAYRGFDKTAVHPELQRMLDWTEVELSKLDVLLDPALLCATLRDCNLFPEVDSLRDRLGEPSCRRLWGGCTVLRAGDVGQRPTDSTLAIR